MSAEENVQVVKNFFGAIKRNDKQALLVLADDEIEWIVPGKDWPMAGHRRGHTGLQAHFKAHAEGVETSFIDVRDFVAQNDWVIVIGFTSGRILATNKPYEDDWVFTVKVRNGKVFYIRAYIDTQAMALASQP
jgi:ketosteroid isomerase-like protein